MKLSNLLILFVFLISANLFSQAHNFRCLENEVYSIGCTTCDNVRTGKMITGMEVDIDGRKTELYNPIIAKYTTTTVTLIDYKFTTVTIKLASTYFASITDLLNAVKVCSDIGFSAGIDTLTYTNDTLKISFKNDSIASYKVKIGDEQYIDTATYASDTLKLSLYNDKKAQTKIYIPASTGTDDQKIDTFSIVSNSLRLSLESDGEIYKSVSLSPYLDNTDAQTLSWVSGSGNLTISGGNTVNLDGRYLLTEVDGSTTNELQNLSYGTKSGIDIPLNISSGAGVNFSEGTNIYLDRLSSNYISIEGRTTIDTFSFASDTLKISLTNDREATKKVYLPPASITNNIVTNGNIITSTVNGVADTTLAIRSVSNTSSTNSLSTTVNGVTGSNVNIINSNSNSLSGNVITGSVNGVIDTVLVIGNVTQTLSTNNLSTSVNGVASNTVSLAGYLDNTDNQALSIRAGKGTIDLTNSVSITLADSSATNEAWTIDGDDADTEVISNQTLKFEGAGIITTDYVPASDKLIITATEVDGSTSNELQNLSYGAKSGSDVPVNISSGAGINLTQGTNIFLDRIASNYLTIEGRTTIDTFSYSSDTLKISLTNDLEAAKKVYIPSGGATTNNIVTNGNIITSTVNGVADTTLAIRSVSNTSSTNSLSTTVNGVTGSNVNIINSNVIGFSNSVLTSTINGVSDTALINISGGTSKGWNGLRYSNDTIFRGSNSSTLDNGSKLRFNTYNYMDTYFDSYINATGGATLPTLHLKANNDVWFGAQDTTTAGTAYAANKPVLFFRYSSDGALNFGLNTTSNINRLGAGAVNFGGTGEAKGDYSFNSGFTGIANSTYAINLGANGQAKTGTYAFNSAGYGISSGFSSISMGYNSTVSNDYAFNSGRSSSVTGYEAANFGAVGTVSGQGAKNFGYSGQVSGSQALGFKENNVTTADQAFNGSYYTYARAYGVSRFGYLGIDFTSQNANNWVSTDILFTVDNGKNDNTRSCALTMNARGWTQHRDLGTTQIKVVDSLAKPKAVLEIVSTTSGMIPAGGTKAQRDAIFNDATQAANFTPTYTKGWVNSAGGSIMDQCGMQFQTTNEALGSSLYALRWDGTQYKWHQIY